MKGTNVCIHDAKEAAVHAHWKTTENRRRKMLGLRQAGITKKCNHCKKKKLVVEFGTHEVKGETVVYAKCIVCRPKHAKTALTSANRAGVVKRHAKTDKCKATNAKYAKGAAGKAARERELAMRKARRAADPAYSKREAIACAATQLISDKRMTSPTFIERTEFVSEESFLAHMASEAEKLGFSMKDYGRRLELEHKIPQEAYDFDDPVDVKRCWSYANVHAMTPKENYEKGIKIIDSLVLEIAPCFWPLSWQGKMPTPTDKDAFYAKAKAEWDNYEPEDEEEEAGPSGSSAGDESDDSDSD